MCRSGPSGSPRCGFRDRCQADQPCADHPANPRAPPLQATDRFRRLTEFYGTDRALRRLNRGTPFQMARRVVSPVYAFTGGANGVTPARQGAHPGKAVGAVEHSTRAAEVAGGRSRLPVELHGPGRLYSRAGFLQGKRFFHFAERQCRVREKIGHYCPVSGRYNGGRRVVPAPRAAPSLSDRPIDPRRT